jgi:Ni/Co efflux regulator RcnB
MKRLLCAALALSLMSGSVAYAQPPGGWGHHDRDRGSDRGYDRHDYRGRHDDSGAAVAAGVGFLALIAILASQDRERRDAQYAPPPPPPGYGYGPDSYQGAYPDQAPNQDNYYGPDEQRSDRGDRAGE